MFDLNTENPTVAESSLINGIKSYLKELELNNMTPLQVALNMIEDDRLVDYFSTACKESFVLFLRVFFLYTNQAPFIMADFHKTIAKTLEDVSKGYVDEKVIILNLPVGSGKSTIVELWKAWNYARNKDLAFAYVSHSQENVTKLSKEVRDIVDCDLYFKYFGIELNDSEKAKTDWSLKDGSLKGGLRARSVGSGSITGLDAGNPAVKGFNGALVCDDLMSAGNELYKNKRKLLEILFNRKLYTRRRTPRTKTILIMQRLHKDDLTAYVIEKYKKDGVLVIKVPALKDDGTSFWQRMKPVDELLNLKERDIYTFQAQYQQEPIESGGSVIDVDMFNFYRLEMLNTMQFEYKIITADTALTKNKPKEQNSEFSSDTDYSVFQCWGVIGNNAYLIDTVKERIKVAMLRTEATAFFNKHNDGLIRAFYIEDAVSGVGLAQELANDGLPVDDLQPAGRNKLTRCRNILMYLQLGMVYLPEDASFTTDLLAECRDFTGEDGVGHDDQVDALVYAIEKIKTSVHEVVVA